MLFTKRHFSRVSPPPPACGETVIRVSNNITHLGCPKPGHKPRQLLSLPPFPSHPLPGKNISPDSHITAISWMKYYFADVAGSVIQSHFNKGLVKMECHDSEKQGQAKVAKKDPALLILNKPPKVPVKGNLPVHNSMDGLAAAALCYDYDEGPKLVHRLDRESSGIILMGRSKESISHLHWLFSDTNRTKSSFKARSDACYQRYWALVIGTPKEKEGLICAPLTKVMLNGGKAERVMLAYGCGLEASQDAIRVHCAEALGTPIVGDYKYGWFVHSRWKQMPRADYEPVTGDPYKMRRPDGLDVQKGSVLSKVPLLHLHCRELVIPNVAKHLQVNKATKSKPDVLRFVASMPTHMKISWNLMSSYLV
ncbi:hypothetical protein M8C21_017731 [Ambrosia artemisiifolia]|uniref:Pseudouridine synthase RsuA/RluA-like domain-containing protein n=1 Tax=Ambrosia artemisiifolia TaxID=4212 RepID=A0AAD5D4E4_AMBAR|nr:hypothetical protein M8C21_017731 [Ambrosia artemisiifolia]